MKKSTLTPTNVFQQLSLNKGELNRLLKRIEQGTCTIYDAQVVRDIVDSIFIQKVVKGGHS